jgi:hypothetical protein
MRKHVKEIGKFFVFVAIFFALTSPFVVLFGPFDNLKRTVIGGYPEEPSSPVHHLAFFAGRNRRNPGRHQLDAEAGTVQVQSPDGLDTYPEEY